MAHRSGRGVGRWVLFVAGAVGCVVACSDPGQSSKQSSVGSLDGGVLDSGSSSGGASNGGGGAPPGSGGGGRGSGGHTNAAPDASGSGGGGRGSGGSTNAAPDASGSGGSGRGSGGADAATDGGTTDGGGALTDGGASGGATSGSGGAGTDAGATSGGGAPSGGGATSVSCSPAADGGGAPEDAGTAPPPMGCTKQISTGEYHTCFIATDGTLWCAGQGTSGQLGAGTLSDSDWPLQVTALGNTVVQVSASQNHTCALTNDGNVWCWGDDAYGELGNGTVSTTPSPVPVEVTGLGAVADGGRARAVSIVAGFEFSCATLEDGTVWCWGRGDLGQLGDPARVTRPSPIQVAVPGSVASVATGAGFACARTTAGTVYCWGHNKFGQLADGTTTKRLTVMEVTALGSDVVEIAAGGYFACARHATGKVECWGESVLSVDGVTQLNALSPVEMKALGTGTTALLARDSFLCATNAGTTYCSDGTWGGIRDGSSLPLPGMPAITVPGVDVASLSKNGGHACVVATDGRAYCWGYSVYGQLARGYSPFVTAPVEVKSLGRDNASLALGAFDTCVVKTDGRLFCFGGDVSGQLGDGKTTSSSVPLEVTFAGTDVAETALGYAHVCVRKTNGSVLCWGYGKQGQLGDGSAANSMTPVVPSNLPVVSELVANFEDTCGITPEGKLFCFGANGAGELGDGTFQMRPAPVEITALGSNVASMALDGSHACALTKDHRIFCSGQGVASEFGSVSITYTPVEITYSGLSGNALEVATGSFHTCARDRSQNLWCWGDDPSVLGGPYPDQMAGLPPNTVVTAWTPALTHLSTGDGTCVVRADGRLFCSDASAPGGSYALGEVTALGSCVKTAVNGPGHSCAITMDGAVWCWGDNTDGEVGILSPASVPAPVAQSCGN